MRIRWRACVFVSGLAVALVLGACSEPPPRVLSIEAVQVDQEKQLVVTYRIGECHTFTDAEARETSLEVAVTVRARKTADVCRAIGLLRTVRITLAEPLGDRAVVDSAGRPVRRR